MILVDRALERRAADGNPLRVAMLGAGFMGRGVANQIVQSVPGMTLVAIVNRSVAKAEAAYREAGVERLRSVASGAELDAAIAAGVAAVSDDPSVLCEAGGVEAILDVTGAVEYGAQVALNALENGKHLVLMNAELDGTVGPILKTYADRAGVVYSGSDGDQPGVQMNLVRFVRSLGLTPLVCGNIKGLQDPYRTPATQRAFAERWGQSPHMVTSFADGTKISFEQAIVANAAGMTVEQRGMVGASYQGHVDEATELYDLERLQALGGVVDYLVGARPAPGVFVYASHDDPKQRRYLNLYKLGEGPLYSFYTPYHLCHFEAPLSLARAVLFDDAALAPAGPPRVEVVATAKRDLRAGEVLDGLGGYCSYGQCERADIVARDGLLPMGVAEGCRLTHDLHRDQVLTYADVQLPADRLIDRLRREQHDRFAAEAAAAAP